MSVSMKWPGTSIERCGRHSALRKCIQKLRVLYCETFRRYGGNGCLLARGTTSEGCCSMFTTSFKNHMYQQFLYQCDAREKEYICVQYCKVCFFRKRRSQLDVNKRKISECNLTPLRRTGERVLPLRGPFPRLEYFLNCSRCFHSRTRASFAGGRSSHQPALLGLHQGFIKRSR